MKIFLATLIATAAFATAAAATDLATSANGKANMLSAKPTVSNAATSMGPTGAKGAAQATGGAATAWKTGDKGYAFQGALGGCHFSGNAGPDGYHLQQKDC